ncbi:MAG: DUF1553 domain-containing protein [Candidatus Hydrogenedens sp.]|nr:DUF1553 domain-containing protein [Candidatus Hydrogenedens sp.]
MDHLSITPVRSLAALAAGLLAALPGHALDSAPDDLFEAKVRPILVEHCVSCHGPEKVKSGLRLDSGEAVYTGGSRGPAVVAGKPEESLLYQAVAHIGNLEMPPKYALEPDAVESIRAWIAAGAAWPDFDPASMVPKDKHAEAAAQHWAFQPVGIPAPPAVEGDWCRNDVDRFVLARMEPEGLHPAPTADKETLLRRVTIDLIGLPPTPEERAAFLADDAPEAYDRVVERLLASPQYGERWARHWLDLVRYTDSFDSRASTVTDPAEIWRYRDWVVQSLNNDLPYDQFLRYQVAGDLISAADGGFNRDGLVATGVLAIGNWPQGDADKEKMVCDIVDDQIDLVTRGFLGLTLSCARCHDHKFEPFTTEDYYGLAGIFFSSSILPGPGAKTEGSPILHLPLASPEEMAARAARDQRLAELRGQRDTLLAEDRAAFARRDVSRAPEYLLAALGITKAQRALDPAAVRKWEEWLGQRPGVLGRLERDTNGIPGLHARRGSQDMPSAVLNLTGKEQHYATITQPPDTIIVHPSPDKPALVAWQSPVAAQVSARAQLLDVDPTCGNGIVCRILAGEEVLAEGVLENGAMAIFEFTEPRAVKPGERLVLSVDPRGDYSCDSTSVEWFITSDSGATWDFRSEVLGQFLDAGPWRDHAGNEEVWSLADPNEAPAAPGLRDELRPLLAAADRDAAVSAFAAGLRERLGNAAVRDELTGERGPFWLDAPPLEEGAPRAAVEAELRDLEEHPMPALDLAVGIQEGAVPNTGYQGFNDVRVHKRGDYNNLGEVVPRRMPAVLASASAQPITEGSGRRELAEWIAGADNPLTARVMVNRIWLHHFGAGLVRTPGDFGTRGEAPTHPELLDYLARAFMDSGWSIKAVHRLMVLSAAYRQDSEGNPESIARDPENRLYARMNRQRAEAEVLRDSLLAVSKQLDLEAGGPAFADINRPRRTLYLKTNRSDRTTFATLFDAADPTAIVPKRVEATVAPQALFLMNHPFVQSVADALAASVAGHADSVEEQVRELYRRLYARDAEPHEIEQAEAYLAAAPPDTALPTYCQALLCANEFVFVD